MMTTEGLMDPFRSYIQIEVQTNATALPVGGLQIDNSGQSLISQSVISSKSV